MSAVTHPRVAVGRGRGVRGWWAKAWLRAVEEASYGEHDLRGARALAGSGAGGVGAVTVDAGGFVAAVTERAGAEAGEVASVRGTVATWEASSIETVVELVAAQAGRIGDLLAGDLPLGLVEDAEEAGVELVPYAGELAATCSCEAWTDPCRHALAVMVVLGRLVDADPLVLFHLRGLDREDLLGRLHARAVPRAGWSDAPADGSPDDVDLAHDAVVRARRALHLIEAGDPATERLF